MTIPGFTSTASKRPSALFGRADAGPRQVTRTDGFRVWDAEGREYIDLIMALGAVALGYGHPAVTRAVTEAAKSGAVGPLSPTLEARVAERLVDVLPGVTWIRFLKTGAEAVAAAVRIARAATGRDRVITCGYHGWLDWCQQGPGIPSAVTQLRREIRFNDIADLRSAVEEFGPVACIVIEPIIDGPQDIAWLTELREVASRTGACLVFDEIKTAFRVACGGVAEQTGVTPDLMVVGKALGNGYPIAAVGGAEALFSTVEDTWISSTLATEFVSLAAANAVLDAFETESVTEALADSGAMLFGFLTGAPREFPDVVSGVHGVPQMCYLSFTSDEVSGAVSRAAAERGLLYKRNAYNFVSLAHSRDVIDRCIAILREALESVR